jgi:CHAT domain-containing protein
VARSGSDEDAGLPVLVGKSSGYPPGWSNLKQAHKEVDAVAEAMKSKRMASTVLKDTSPGELSPASMLELLPTASWVHLSVHGEVSSQFPQGSLLFSDDDGQRLTAEQIITLAPSGWRARAVVASACQSGLGAVAGTGCATHG